MALFVGEERPFAQGLSELMYGNPFLPSRIELEQRLLGDAYEPLGEVWSLRPDGDRLNPNARLIGDRAVALVENVRGRINHAGRVSVGDRQLYEDLVVYALYHSYRGELQNLASCSTTEMPLRVPFWESFCKRVHELAAIPDRPLSILANPDHWLACFFQVRRAFVHIFEHIVGTSMPTARLRARIWESIFTHNMRRYRQTLFASMGDITTLVLGPSGTGKELVARAIALARYVPFDLEKQAFLERPGQSFFALNLSALSPTLIESELFGHRQGSFTGAFRDRKGWLETCPPAGAVFLDEIGELDAAIQVKLLRVLQTRVFQRLGDTDSRRFSGKLIAATNRDLAAQVASGRMRMDFYYRICADVVRTPTLAEQLAAAPGDLEQLVRHIVLRVSPAEVDTITRETVEWIEANLTRDYTWPGNIRELEQCIRSLIVHGEYEPLAAAADPSTTLARHLDHGDLTAEELLTRYCQIVYAKTGSYQATGKRLGLDRRTVRSRVNDR